MPSRSSRRNATKSSAASTVSLSVVVPRIAWARLKAFGSSQTFRTLPFRERWRSGTPFSSLGVVPIRLTHLNPLFADLASEDVALEGPGVPQLCVPVMKNQQSPSRQFFNHTRFSDVLCSAMQGLPLNRQLTLTHLNPVLRGLGLPPENVYTDSDRLCVRVAKNGLFPPG
jgi:hypothetical protein